MSGLKTANKKILDKPVRPCYTIQNLNSNRNRRELMTTYKQHSLIKRSAVLILAVLAGLTLALRPYPHTNATINPATTI